MSMIRLVVFEWTFRNGSLIGSSFGLVHGLGILMVPCTVERKLVQVKNVCFKFWSRVAKQGIYVM